VGTGRRRAVLRDVLNWDYVEDTPSWLIFKLPPAEVGIHPSEGSSFAASRTTKVSASRRRCFSPAESG
jgi:hypothetical protein